jgi:hypothetical protein
MYKRIISIRVHNRICVCVWGGGDGGGDGGGILYYRSQEDLYMHIHILS